MNGTWAGWLAPRTAWRATAWYVAVTLGMTWPLAAGLARDIPWDLGDSILNCWILAWNSERLLRLLGGDLTALAGFYDANIFHPQKLTLAYSELLFAQTIQGLPVYAATGNIILTYNLVFLSTFVLSGLGTYLLVHDLTGDWRAAFVAGVAFAFLPWRFAQMPHMQVLSTQWMPFSLYALRRYFTTRRGAALAGAVASIVLNNHSNGYFLLFFAPMVVGYSLWEMAVRGLLRDLRAWAAMATAGLVVAVCTVPFMLPYVWLRQATGERRSIEEARAYSADVYAYLTAEPALTLIGPWLQVFPRAEGHLFPGFLVTILAASALVWGGGRAWRATRDLGPLLPASTGRPWRWARRALGGSAFAVAGLHLGVVLALLAGYRGRYFLGPVEIRIFSLMRALGILAGAVAVGLACSPRARAMLWRARRSAVLMFAVFTLLAWWLSLGPQPQSYGRPLHLPGLYQVLWDHVPGFDGLRVPARYAALVMLGLSVLTGFAVRDLSRRARRTGPWLAGLTLAVLVESTAVPIPVNLTGPDRELPPEPRVHPRHHAPAVYQFLSRLPEGTVILELPFADITWELRYVFYATVHWKPLVNGYSGGFPPTYLHLASHLSDPLRAPDDAWRALTSSGATHVVLHTNAYVPDRAADLRQWLLGQGAVPLARFDAAEVYRLKP